MNSHDVLRYGHAAVQQVVRDIPDSVWEKTGACGVWSVKDIIAHLTSFEHVLEEVLTSIVESETHTSTPSTTTPYLTRFIESGVQFNNIEVHARQEKTVTEVLAEYDATHAEVMALIVQVPEEMNRRTRTLPWYGVEYSLDDFIVYAFYGHKREHCGQIALVHDRV